VPYIRATGLLIILVLGLAAAGARPADRGLPVDEPAVARTLAALGPGVTRTETDHFVILCDGSAEWSRGTASLLETTADQFTRLMRHLDQPIAPLPGKLQCVLIRDHDRFEAFAAAQDDVDARWMGGYYATHTNRIVFYDTLTAPDFLEASRKLDGFETEAKRAEQQARDASKANRKLSRAYRDLAERVRDAEDQQRGLLKGQAARAGAAKTTHEAAHLLAFNAGLQLRSRQYPFWLSEGLATCFEASSVDAARKGLFGPDRENTVRQREFAAALSAASLIPLEAFVELNSPPENDEATARVMYAQAHALFRWLHRYEKESLGGIFRDLAAEPAGNITPERQGQLFRARFGDLARLERRWLREAGTEALRVAAAPEEP
jgi:hypothetical protein